VDVSSQLSRKNHDVYIITFDERLCRLVNFPVFRPTQRRLTRRQVLSRLGDVCLIELSLGSLFPTSESYRNIKNLLQSCDIIYTKNEVPDMLILRFLANSFRSVVCGIHTAVWYTVQRSLRSRLHNLIYMSRMYGYLLRQCSAIHIPSVQYFRLMSNLRVNKSNLFWIPYGIDPPNLFPTEKSGEEHFTILFAGRLTEQKGIDVLCKAVDILSKKPAFDNMLFQIAGSGELEHLIMDLCRRHHNVKYLGHVEQNKMPETYSSHDIVIVPSRWESLPFACIEPQACGVPVIASDIPGPKEVVTDRVTGILFPPESAEALAKAILDLLHLKESNPRKFHEMKNLARRNALAKFSAQVVIERLEHMFLQVLKKNR